MGCGSSTDASAYSNRGSIQDMKPMEQQRVDSIGAANGNHTEPIVDKATLEEYLQTEKDIAEARRADPQVLSQLELKTEALEKVSEQLDRLERDYEDIQALVDASSSGRDTRTALGHLGARADPSSAEEERVAGANRKEIVKQERDEAVRQKENIQREVDKLQTKAARLQELYAKNDALLGKIFGGEYGSDLENRLEQELDVMEAQKARIMEANYKWRQAQMMMAFACRQLAVAVQKWQDLPEIPQDNLELRYTMAAEARNNLVAASQNISGAHRYLTNVEFPYCTPEEVDTLNKATSYVFTDMQSPERHAHANECYVITHKRANALLQWFDQVLTTTIMQDLSQVSKRVKETSLGLREERIRLIKLKAKEIWGEDVDIEVAEGVNADDEDLNALLMQGVNDSEVAKTQETESGVEMQAPPPLNADEMAPMPSNESIFGRSLEQMQEELDSLHREHETELDMFKTNQERHAAKLKGDLEAKLNARRRNRAMRHLEEKQQEELAAGVSVS